MGCFPDVLGIYSGGGIRLEKERLDIVGVLLSSEPGA